MTFEFPLILLGGLLGSSHCVGMCGPFALIAGIHSTGRWHNLSNQLAYSCGRIFTYACLGALAGACGMSLARSGSVLSASAILSVLAGVVLVLQGLASAGIRLFPGKSGTQNLACVPLASLRGLLKSRGRLGLFLAGMFTGFLPCGLLYGFVTLAASTGDFLQGAAVMTLFGLGTVPLMVFTGLGGAALSLVARRRLLTVAAWCVVLTGVWTIARGAYAFWAPAEDPSRACPFCAGSNQQVDRS